MGYRVLDPAAVEPTPDRPSVQRAVGDELDLENIAVNVYEADPGESVPLAYHYHTTQEELFYVVSGELHVETPDRTYVAGAGELFAVEPDSPQRAFNPETADGPVELLAVGAPPADDAHPYDQ